MRRAAAALALADESFHSGGASLGANDRVVGVFEDQYAIRHADAKRAGSPPSPITVAMTGTSRSIISRRFTAMVADVAFLGAVMPGQAPAVSMRVMMGSPNLFAA